MVKYLVGVKFVSSMEVTSITVDMPDSYDPMQDCPDKLYGFNQLRESIENKIKLDMFASYEEKQKYSASRIKVISISRLGAIPNVSGAFNGAADKM